MEKQIKLQEIENKFAERHFMLKAEEIELLVNDRVTGATKYFLKSIFTIQEVESIFDEKECNDQKSALVMYLDQFSGDEQSAALYPLIREYMPLREVLLEVIQSLALVDYKRIEDWFITDVIELQHLGLSILKLTKAEYSSDDVVA